MTLPIEVRNLVKRYGDFTAVDHVTLEVSPGRIFALLGPNGAGKTSTIRIVMGILFPDEGEVRLFGKPPHEIRHQVGYLPESRGLYRDARLLELLVYLATLKGLSPTLARERALSWLERFDLQDWAHRKVHELSHGMQQKAQLIATVLHDPPLLILDEPFQGLDPVNVQLVKELITELRQLGKTILLSSHQLNHVEALADDIALIHRGRIVAQGTLQQLRKTFSRGEIAIRLARNDKLPEGLPIQRAQRQNGGWLLLPEPGTTPQEILHRVVAQGIAIEHFEVVYPNLESIFLQAVTAQSAEGGTS